MRNLTYTVAKVVDRSGDYLQYQRLSGTRIVGMAPHTDTGYASLEDLFKGLVRFSLDVVASVAVVLAESLRLSQAPIMIATTSPMNSFLIFIRTEIEKL